MKDSIESRIVEMHASRSSKSADASAASAASKGQRGAAGTKWVVKSVHGKRTRAGSSYEYRTGLITEYLVRWEGLGDVETWQDLGELSADERCAQLVRQFEAQPARATRTESADEAPAGSDSHVSPRTAPAGRTALRP